MIISNNIINNSGLNEIDTGTIKDFLINCRELYGEFAFESIYYSNINIKRAVKEDSKLNYIDLGTLDNEILIDYLVFGRG